MPSSPIPPFARHGRLPRSRPAMTVLVFVAAALAVVLVSAGAVASFAVYDVAKSGKPGVKLIGQKDGPAPDIGSFEGGINVLVAASDSGGGDVGTYGKRGEHLNDVTMLLHVSADHTNATVVSFPRDMIVPIASCPNPKGGHFPAQTNKINVALTYGGLPCIVKTVENLSRKPALLVYLAPSSSRCAGWVEFTASTSASRTPCASASSSSAWASWP